MQVHYLPRCCVLAASLAILFISATQSQADPITAFTADGPRNGSNDLVGPVNAVTSITAGGVTYSNFVGPVSSANVVSNEVRFKGSADPGAIPPADQVLLGNNLVQAIANVSNGTSNGPGQDLFFPTTIADNDGGNLDSMFEVFLLELGGGDNFNIAPITGTVDSPVVGPFTFFTASGGLASPLLGETGELRNSNNSNINDFLYGGFAIDISELGVSELIGVRVSASVGDPAVVLAVNQVVPEASSLAMFTLIGLVAGGMLIRQQRKAKNAKI